jgi:hypothetical protein
MLPRFVGVVRAAAQLQVVDRSRTAIRERHDMMEFQEPRFPAATVSANKRASASVARPHGTSHISRHMTPARVSRPRRTRPLNVRQFSSLEIFEQERQRSVEDRCWLSARHNMSK